MKIKETIHQKVAVLSLRGKLMGPPATNELFERVAALIADGVIRIVLDLSHVNWINSMGVGAVMKCLTAVRDAEGHLHLSGPTEKVHSVFVMSQLTKLFPIHENVDEAIIELNKT